MKKSMFFTSFLIGISFVMFQSAIYSQELLVENFDYTLGTLLTANGWTAHSAGANPVTVTAPSISYTGYQSSGIGNETTLANTGEDVHRTFSPRSEGSVYAGFLVNVTAASTGGDYFFHLGQTTIGTVFRGRVFVKRDASSNLAFGISYATTTAASIAYSGYTFALNTTYLIIVKYTVVPGTGNDVVDLFINPVIGNPEPTPTLTATDVNSDLTEVGSVALRQGGSSSGPSLKLDGIRIGQTWADVAGSGSISAPTLQTSNLSFANVSQTQMDVSWTSGNGSSRIVKINTTNSFTPPSDNTSYPANSLYTGSGEQVVYNGPASAIPTVTGLATATTYYFQAWEYNGTGSSSLYCFTVGANNPNSQATSASATPPVVNTPTATAITPTGATLGGNVAADGGAAILERGTVWSLSSPVTIADNKLVEGLTTTGVFTHARSGMPSNTLIYYAAFASNSAGTTLSAEGSFTTLLGEPTNHAASFAAASSLYSTVTTTWSDNDGIQPATGFLILANQTGTFTDPVNGTPVTNDANLNDGSGAMNIIHGVQTYTWTGLTSSTQYYFAIYAYTNTGSNIIYKTIPAAPTASATTQTFVAPVAAWTFDATPAQPNTPTSVAASFGDQTGTAYLYADGTNGSSAWLPASELNAFAGTTVNDPREGGAVLSGMSYCEIGGTDLSANGKSIVIKFSMSALQDAVLTYATRYSGTTGFTSQQWAWSIDGSSFTDFGTATVSSTSFSVKTLDLTAIDAIDGAPEVYLKVTFTGVTAPTSNNRLDNIVIRASAATNLPPTVFTTTANPVGVNTATLNGTVNANNQSTTVQFVYGPDTNYGSTIDAVPATVTGGIVTAVSANLTGLTMNSTYHYKVIATNGSGSSSGNDMTFTTACELPADAGEITGSSIVCGNGVTQYQFSVPPINLATDYIWSFPGGTEIISGLGTNVVTAVFVPVNPTWDVSVFGTNVCGDGNASAPFSITITPPLEVEVSIVASANPVAAGTPVTFTATPSNGGTTPVYQWFVNGSPAGTNSPTFVYTPALAGNYSVECELTSNGECVTNNPAVSAPILLEVTGTPADITVTGTVAPVTAVCYGATNTITVAGGATTFEILSGGSATFIAGQKITFLPGTTVQSGGYMLAYIAPSGPFCPAPPIAPEKIAGQEVSGLNMTDNTFRIYPNPTSGSFTIEQRGESVAGHVQVEILGTLGGRILSTELENTRKQELSIQGNPPGVYFVKINTGTKSQTIKIILTK